MKPFVLCLVILTSISVASVYRDRGGDSYDEDSRYSSNRGGQNGGDIFTSTWMFMTGMAQSFINTISGFTGMGGPPRRYIDRSLSSDPRHDPRRHLNISPLPLPNHSPPPSTTQIITSESPTSSSPSPENIVSSPPPFLLEKISSEENLPPLKKMYAGFLDVIPNSFNKVRSKKISTLRKIHSTPNQKVLPVPTEKSIPRKKVIYEPIQSSRELVNEDYSVSTTVQTTTPLTTELSTEPRPTEDPTPIMTESTTIISTSDKSVSSSQTDTKTNEVRTSTGPSATMTQLPTTTVKSSTITTTTTTTTIEPSTTTEPSTMTTTTKPLPTTTMKLSTTAELATTVQKRGSVQYVEVKTTQNFPSIEKISPPSQKSHDEQAIYEKISRTEASRTSTAKEVIPITTNSSAKELESSTQKGTFTSSTIKAKSSESTVIGLLRGTIHATTTTPPIPVVKCASSTKAEIILKSTTPPKLKEKQGSTIIDGLKKSVVPEESFPVVGNNLGLSEKKSKIVENNETSSKNVTAVLKQVEIPLKIEQVLRLAAQKLVKNRQH